MCLKKLLIYIISYGVHKTMQLVSDGLTLDC